VIRILVAMIIVAFGVGAWMQAEYAARH